MNYIANELIVFLDNDPSHQCYCMVCDFRFKTYLPQTVKRHYSRNHGYEFLVQDRTRHKKARLTSPELVNVQEDTVHTIEEEERDCLLDEDYQSKDPTSDDSSAPSSYQESKLVRILGHGGRYACECLLCGSKFASRKKFNIQRHYLMAHSYTSKQILKTTKRRSEATLPSQSVIQYHVDIKKRFADISQYLQACVDHHITNQLSPAYWNSDTTRQFHELFRKTFNVNVTSTRMQKHIQAVTEENKTKGLRDQLSGKLFNLRIHVRSRRTRYCLVLSAQYARHFTIQNTRIGNIVLDHEDQPNLLVTKINELLAENGLTSEQIYCATTDNGSNMLEPGELFRKTADDRFDEEDFTSEVEQQTFDFQPVVRCAAHTIQLAIHDGLSAYHDELKELRELVIIMRTRICVENKEIDLPPFLEGDPWPAIYENIEVILAARESLYENIRDRKWTFMRNLHVALKPLHKLYNKLRTEEYIAGDLARDILLCEKEMKSNENGINLSLSAAFEYRKRLIFGDEYFLGAIYLDPRLNNRLNSLLNDEEKASAILFLMKTHKRIRRVEEGAVNRAECSWMEDLVPSTAVIKMEQQRPNRTELEHRIANISGQNRPLTDINVMQYWKEKTREDAELGELASVVLSLPVSQVIGEKAFNTSPEWVFGNV